MNDFINFITNNIALLIVIFLVIVALIKAIIAKNKQKIYANIYALVSDAEKLVSVTGVDKFNYVFDKGYNKLPAALKFFISEDDIKRAIEYSLNKLKDYAKLQSSPPIS